MNYEFYMRAAIAESAAAGSSGERARGAIAVMEDAMVARARDHVQSSGDPTAHAVVSVLREASRRLGRPSLSGLTVFCAVEPCAMCVGALLQSDADSLVFALTDPIEGAAGSVLQVADTNRLPRRLSVVSGILQEEAAELRPRSRSEAAGAPSTLDTRGYAGTR